MISELIQKKRDGQELGSQDISRFIAGIGNQQVSDAHIAAFAMAVWFQDLTAPELCKLTLAMRDSGTVLRWEGLDGPVIDKHSTGGVGDLVSLVLAPMVAACGGYVPMISGRGLGHTGGTLDKLESIPGFNTSPAEPEFQRLVKRNGLSIIGQTEQLAPADGRIYAVRDVTATVASTALIVSSILSKKLAAGLDALVMDIKVGNGAFMKSMEEAHALAARLCHTASDAGLACHAFLSDMSQPMSWTAGNALEMREACDYLAGHRRHPRLHDLVMAVASEMLLLGGLAGSQAEASSKLQQALTSGAAAEKFARMVADQDGPGDLLEQPDRYLAVAHFARPLLMEQPAYISAMDMTQIGLAVVRLGGGRFRAEDSIDHAVGLSGLKSPGSYLEAGEEVLVIHARNESEWEEAAAQCRAAIEFTDHAAKPVNNYIVLDRIRGDREKEYD
ncbi:MAG TPA: thymidine phosphorylase [Xanthomonadales bacterium]|nr:thymidine phosphorylase [Xanthomonadales bacterium]